MSDTKVEEGVEFAGYLDERAIAQKFGRSLFTVQKWMRDSGIHFRRVGNRKFFKIEDIQEWMDNR